MPLPTHLPAFGSRSSAPGACSPRSTCTAVSGARSPIRRRSVASSRSVIDAIGMRAHGPLMIERFGDGDLEGWSALQFIETSSITIHADEVSGRCFVDVFSCRPFDPDLAAAIAVEHFGGTPTLRVLQR